MPKAGPKEEALRERRQERATKGATARPSRPVPPAAIDRVAKGRAKFDRSPRAVADFIAAAGAAGRAMADIEKRFKMDGHGLRNKIKKARHELGVPIHFDGSVYKIKEKPR